MSFLSWLRGLVAVPSGTSTRKADRQRSLGEPIPLRLEELEHRFCPTVQLSYNGPGTPLTLTEDGSGSITNVTLSDSGTTTLTIDLGSQKFASTSTPSKTGLTYKNAGSPTTSNSATIDISQSNNITLLQALLAADSLSVGIIADLRGGIGAISASASTIKVQSLITSNATPGNVSLQATALLQIDSNGLIDTGNGLISLAADVNADGAGNANTNPLTIASGAVVVSTNPSQSAITLRSAQVNIATGADPAVVGEAPVLGATPATTLSGLNQPQALAFDGSGNLFVANISGGTVSEFAQGSTTATATLGGLSGPNGLAFDGSGNLFVVTGGTVSEFAAGSTTATATLSGLYAPGALACDGSGNLFVANYFGGTVSEFAAGSTTAMATLGGLNEPQALAFDANGNLYVANNGNGTVSEFAAGSTTAMATLGGLNHPQALACDGSGNLFVVNFGTFGGGGTVSEFASGSTTATATLSGLSNPYALAFDAQGNLFVANYFGATVSEFAPGSTTAKATLSGLYTPTSLAFDDRGNLFVTNEGGTTVSEFTPASYTPAAGGVVIRTAQTTEAMSIGGSAAPANTLSLTSAELAQLFTTSRGDHHLRRRRSDGNHHLPGRHPRHDQRRLGRRRAGVRRLGRIFLDDSHGVALNAGSGNVTLNAGTGGIAGNASDTTAEIATTGEVYLNTSGGIGTASNRIQVDATSTPAQRDRRDGAGAGQRLPRRAGQPDAGRR